MASPVRRQCSKCKKAKDRDKDFAPSSWICLVCSQQTAAPSSANVRMSALLPKDAVPNGTGLCPLGLVAEVWNKVFEFRPSFALSRTCHQLWSLLGLKHATLRLELADYGFGCGNQREYNDMMRHVESQNKSKAGLKWLEEHVKYPISLDITFHSGSMDSLSILQQVPQLTTFRFENRSLENACPVIFDSLSNMKGLQHLSLQIHLESDFVPKLIQLTELKCLESLSLNLIPTYYAGDEPDVSPQVTQAIAAFATLPLLQSLDVGLLRITDSAAAPLAGLRKSSQLRKIAFTFKEGTLGSGGVTSVKEIITGPSLQSVRIDVTKCDISQCYNDLQALTCLTQGPHVTIKFPEDSSP